MRSSFIALVGLICSIIGYKKADEYANGGNKGLALAGIIISAISMVLAVIIVILEVAVIGAAVSAL